MYASENFIKVLFNSPFRSHSWTFPHFFLLLTATLQKALKPWRKNLKRRLPNIHWTLSESVGVVSQAELRKLNTVNLPKVLKFITGHAQLSIRFRSVVYAISGHFYIRALLLNCSPSLTKRALRVSPDKACFPILAQYLTCLFIAIFPSV